MTSEVEKSKYIERVPKTIEDDVLDDSVREVLRYRYAESLSISTVNKHRDVAARTVDCIVKFNLIKEYKEFVSAIWAQNGQMSVLVELFILM